MSPHVSETVLEDAALDWFESLGYATLHGPDIAPGEPAQLGRRGHSGLRPASG